MFHKHWLYLHSILDTGAEFLDAISENVVFSAEWLFGRATFSLPSYMSYWHTQMRQYTENF